MNLKKLTFAAAVALLFGTTGCTSQKGRGFAIVIDPKSYEEAQTQVAAYAAELEKSGLTVHTVIDRWGVPDSIRAALQALYTDKKAPIEGAILLGDIPVAMVRDAQHMTSAFKMNQDTYSWFETSVPSDRFYDDFDLEFDFLKQDEERPHLFYYSLTANSAQSLSCEIYTGRVRPTDCNGTSRYEKLRRFLEKAVAEKQAREVMDQLLFFSGHGYVSESLTARLDEKVSYYESFPWLKAQQNGIEYIDHKQAEFIKFKLMDELQRENLDLAVLHHHGDWDTQYMNMGMPPIESPASALPPFKEYLRSSLRHAKDRGRNVDSVRNVLMKHYDVPLSWFAGAFDPEVMKADSISDANSNLILSDFENYRPQCRVVLFDACYNGSFHRDSCIANAYIFGEGSRTVAVTANSVNVLQDKWTDRYAGAVALGMNVGRMTQFNPYLEGHLIGDPTYTFVPAVKVPDLNKAIASWSASRWKKELKKTPYAAVKLLAVEELHRKGAISSDELLHLFRTSSDGIVRMEAMMTLADINDENFVLCLLEAANDSYEMVARFAMNFIADCGDPRLAEAVVAVGIRNNTSERVEFSVKGAIPLFEKEVLLAEFERQFPHTNYRESEKVHGQIEEVFEKYAPSYAEYVDEIIDPETNAKKRIFAIRFLRNNQVHFRVPDLIAFVQQCDDPDAQVVMLEAFGWWRLSYRAAEIREAVLAMSQDESLPEKVRNEALKTYNRLK